MDEKFIEKLTDERKKAIKEYLQDNSYELLKKIETYSAILTMNSIETQVGITRDMTNEMMEQMKQVDFSKLDMNELMKQMG